MLNKKDYFEKKNNLKTFSKTTSWKNINETIIKSLNDN